jgi:hypothetical protein
MTWRETLLLLPLVAMMAAPFIALLIMKVLGP